MSNQTERARPKAAVLMIAARKRKRLTQRAAAVRLQCSASNVAMIEAGRSRPSLDLAYRIEDVLGVRARYWFVQPQRGAA